MQSWIELGPPKDQRIVFATTHYPIGPLSPWPRQEQPRTCQLFRVLRSLRGAPKTATTLSPRIGRTYSTGGSNAFGEWSKRSQCFYALPRPPRLLISFREFEHGQGEAEKQEKQTETKIISTAWLTNKLQKKTLIVNEVWKTPLVSVTPNETSILKNGLHNPHTRHCNWKLHSTPSRHSYLPQFLLKPYIFLFSFIAYHMFCFSYPLSPFSFFPLSLYPFSFLPLLLFFFLPLSLAPCHKSLFLFLLYLLPLFLSIFFPFFFFLFVFRRFLISHFLSFSFTSLISCSVPPFSFSFYF